MGHLLSILDCWVVSLFNKAAGGAWGKRISKNPEFGREILTSLYADE